MGRVSSLLDWLLGCLREALAAVSLSLSISVMNSDRWILIAIYWVLDAGEKGGESLDLYLGCERLGIRLKPLEMEMASCGSKDGASTLMRTAQGN
jgi:hypothetical protein